ncbi:MAG: type II secretion system protein GspD [Planctomycetota bacterium]
MLNHNDHSPLRSSNRIVRNACFIATLAASGVAFAQDAAPPADAAPAAAQSAPAPATGKGQVTPSTGKSSGDTFTVQFQETDILQALQMLSLQGRRNIVASKGVSGSVTANLYDVTVFEALEVLMRANGLRMEESGNFIYVYTAEEFDELQRSRLKRESRSFKLEYLNAKDAADFITPMLSAQGKVSFVGDVDKGFQASASDGGTDSWALQGMIVVSDFADQLGAIEKLLKDIDTPPSQVVVESTVIGTNVDQADGFGVDISVIGDLSFTDLTNPTSAASDLFLGNEDGVATNQASAVNSNVAGWDNPSTLRVGVISDDVAVFLRMLDQVTDTTVLARPRVMTLNRQRAQILIGTRVGYLSATTTQTATTQSVEFLDSGIKLIFRPFISSDGSIRMELAPSVSEAKIVDLQDTSGQTLPVPNEDTSEIVTNVRVKDGQTLVLGGLFKETTKVTRRQVPVLGDVPILGNAFKGYDDEMKRQEIIFLITPTIVKDEIARIWSDEAREFERAARIGAREGLLPFSRDTLTTEQNQAAIEAMAKGDSELALHHVENSLRLQPTQPEMIRLREMLQGNATTAGAHYERSMIQRVIKSQLLNDADPTKPKAAPVAAPGAAGSATTAPKSGGTASGTVQPAGGAAPKTAAPVKASPTTTAPAKAGG